MAPEDGDEAWWEPGKKVGGYYFETRASDMPNFYIDHTADIDFPVGLEPGDQNFVSRDQGYAVSLENEVISSVTCEAEFYVRSVNAVGRSLAFFTDEMEKRFSGVRVVSSTDVSVVYEDGSVTTDIDYEDFCAFVTIDEDAKVLAVSCYSDAE